MAEEIKETKEEKKGAAATPAAGAPAPAPRRKKVRRNVPRRRACACDLQQHDRDDHRSARHRDCLVEPPARSASRARAKARRTRRRWRRRACARKCSEVGMRAVVVHVKGPGGGRESQCARCKRRDSVSSRSKTSPDSAQRMPSAKAPPSLIRKTQTTKEIYTRLSASKRIH